MRCQWQTERACFHCHETKPVGLFPPRGRQQKGKVHNGLTAPGPALICWACVEADAHAMDARGFRNKRRRTFVVAGLDVRECRDCNYLLPLTHEFYSVKSRKSPTGHVHRNSKCRECVIVEQRERRRKRSAADPEYRARKSAARRRALETEEGRERAKAAQRRYREKVMADPEKAAAWREKARIEHRLRREREGVPLESIRANLIARRERSEMLPAAPLAAFINARIEARMAINRFIGDDTEKVGAKADICSELGIHPRSLYRLEHETGNVTIALAEEVLLRAGVAWGDVYSYDDHADLYATVLEGLV